MSWIDTAVNDTYHRIEAERDLKSEALRVLLNVRREIQAGDADDSLLSPGYSYCVRDDEDDTLLEEMFATMRVPRRAATAPTYAWLYQLPSKGTFVVHGHGVVTVSLHNYSPDHSTSLIIRGGLSVATLRTSRIRTTATVNPMVGAWHNAIRVKWIDVDLSDHERRVDIHRARSRVTKQRKRAFDGAVATLLAGGSLMYLPGIHGGKVIFETDNWYVYHDFELSANQVLTACGLLTEAIEAVRAATLCNGTMRMSLPHPFDSNDTTPCYGVVKQLRTRAARLPARDRRRAVTEWYEEEAA